MATLINPSYTCSSILMELSAPDGSFPSSPCIRVQDKLKYEPPILVTAAAPYQSEAISRTHATYELSNVDQMFNLYLPVALFYYANERDHAGVELVAAVLKSALEEVLVHYPWAAGRLRLNTEQQRLEVECSGKGAQFVAAHADINLAQLGDVSSPHPALDALFARLDLDTDPGLIVGLQVTQFRCGGFVLSLIANHAVFDGYGASVFLQNLCSIARGAGLAICPDNVSRRERMRPRRPPRPTAHLHPHIVLHENWYPSHGTNTAKSYTFLAQSLDRLRRRAQKNQPRLAYCSRFHALAAYLWLVKARSLPMHVDDDDNGAQVLPLRIPVNVRERIGTTLTRGYTGNAVCNVTIKARVEDLQRMPLAVAVLKIKHAIANVTSEFVQSETDYIEALGGAAHLDDAGLAIISVAGLPFYDVDCGWGKPMYLKVQPHYNRLFILKSVGMGSQSLDVLALFQSDAERVKFEKALKDVEEYCFTTPQFSAGLLRLAPVAKL